MALGVQVLEWFVLQLVEVALIRLGEVAALRLMEKPAFSPIPVEPDGAPPGRHLKQPSLPSLLHRVPKTTLLSSTPGRVRLGVAGLRGSGQMAQVILDIVQRLPGVESVTANSATGNVLVVFDHEQTDPSEIRAGLELATALSPRPSREPRPRTPQLVVMGG